MVEKLHFSVEFDWQVGSYQSIFAQFVPKVEENYFRLLTLPNLEQSLNEGRDTHIGKTGDEQFIQTAFSLNLTINGCLDLPAPFEIKKETQ